MCLVTDDVHKQMFYITLQMSLLLILKIKVMTITMHGCLLLLFTFSTKNVFQ